MIWTVIENMYINVKTFFLNEQKHILVNKQNRKSRGAFIYFILLV